MSEPRKREILLRGEIRWKVDFGMVAGQRKRSFFRTEAEADKAIADFAKQTKKEGDFLARLTDTERAAVISSLMEMRQADVTIAQVWADWQRWKKDNGQGSVTPMPYEDVVTEWFRRKTSAGKTSRYVGNTRDVLDKFGKGRERLPIHQVTVDDLEGWFDAQTDEHDWSLSTRRTYMLLFSSLWSVAVAKGWCSLMGS